MNEYILYNVVIDKDLYFTIYDYVTCNPNAAKQYNVSSRNDLEELSLQDWKDIAEDAIFWLKNKQLPKVYVINSDMPSPGLDTWGTLYYQSLAYIDRNKINKKICGMLEINDIIEICSKAIDDLTDLKNKIRPLTEKDLEKI